MGGNAESERREYPICAVWNDRDIFHVVFYTDFSGNMVIGCCTEKKITEEPFT